jgi:hypothetical protein
LKRGMDREHTRIIVRMAIKVEVMLNPPMPIFLPIVRLHRNMKEKEKEKKEAKRKAVRKAVRKGGRK